MAAWAAGLKAYGSCGCRGEAEGECSDYAGRNGGRLLGMQDRLPTARPRHRWDAAPQLHQPPSHAGRAAPRTAPEHPVHPAAPPPPPTRAPSAHPGAVVVVIPHEGVEGAQLGPAHAQLLGRVTHKAADVGTHQRHPKEVEEQHLCGGGAEGIGAPRHLGRRAQGEAAGCGGGAGGDAGVDAAPAPRSLPGTE